MTIAKPNYDGIYDGAISALAVIFATADQMPSQMHDKLDAYVGKVYGQNSPVDVICNFVESVYANRPALVVDSTVTSGTMLVAAGCASVIAESGFWNYLDGRVAGIGQALRRDAGEEAAPGFPWPDPADDPAPKFGYGPPAS